MEVLITEHNVEGPRTHFNMICKNMEVYVCHNSESNVVNVICKNASHRVYRSMGRFFDDWSKAIDGYKSGAVKEMISTAKEITEAKE